MKSFNNFIIFKTDKLFEDHVQYKGVDGKDLFFENGFDPAKHARIYGEVVSLPIRLSHGIPISQQTKGLPGYHEQTPYVYRYVSDVEQEVEIGDRIYFHFNTIKNHNIVKVEGTHPNRVWYIKVRYDNVYCAIRDGKIIMIAGNTLVDPDFESWEDISVPTYSDLLGEDGKQMLKPKEQWLVTKSMPTYKYLAGFVRHIGSPLKGDKCECVPGQKILYHRNADFMIKVEGREYFMIKQRHIIGRFE
jgi:hypothetical protein